MTWSMIFEHLYIVLAACLLSILIGVPMGLLAYLYPKARTPILRTVDMDDYSSLQYFQRVLQNSGIIEKLEEMGIQDGDTVDIYDLQFDYQR